MIPKEEPITTVINNTVITPENNFIMFSVLVSYNDIIVYNIIELYKLIDETSTNQ